MMILRKLILIIAGMILATNLFAVDHKFIGAGSCKMCHKGAAKGSQFEVWEASAHAKAFATLKTDAAVKAAQEKGIKVPPSEAPECLKCHVTAAATPALRDAKFDPAMGVQCESCHGAGADYKAIAVMKDKAKAIENGMHPIQVADGSAEKRCITCHNPENPFHKGFDFKQAWQKIKHDRPKT